MLQIVVVVLVARGLALVLRRFGQSDVIAEMAAGFTAMTGPLLDRLDRLDRARLRRSAASMSLP
jgi:Kef-type K+ transport system membrane component KefB